MHENIEYLIQRGWDYKQSKNNYVGKCPYWGHDDSNPSFSIDTVTGKFQCFSCNKGGESLVTLMMNCENLTKEEVIEKLNPDKRVREDWDYKRLRQTIDKAQEYMSNIVNAGSSADPIFQSITKWLRDYFSIKRKMNIDVIRRYKIGLYHISLVDYMKEEGFTDKDLKRANLLSENGLPFHNRIMLPIISNDQVIGWSARAIKKNQEPKYLTLINTKYYPKDKFLWGYDKAKHYDEVVLTEGIFDSIKMNETGHPSVCTLGTAISEENIKQLKIFKTIGLMLDSDNPGQEATESFYFKSRCVLLNNKIYVVQLSKSKDACEASEEEIKMAYLKSKPISEWYVDRNVSNKSLDDAIIGFNKVDRETKNFPEFERKLILQTLQASIVSSPFAFACTAKSAVESGKKYGYDLSDEDLEVAWRIATKFKHRMIDLRRS